MIVFFVTQLFPSNAYCVENHIFNEILIAINSSLPDRWKELPVEYDIHPRWSFSEDKCCLIKMFGPNMSGRKYYDKNGMFLGERRIYNELISIWVGDESFDPELTLLNRIKNRLSIVPEEIPAKIFEYQGYKVYAGEGGITLPENEHLANSSFPGTYKSEHWAYDNGISWPTWADDLKKALEEHFRTTKKQ
jgi:hypothetical protein